MKQYNLDRFIQAQNNDYEVAYKEVANGHKQSHWMWYIFPQIKGLGKSDIANFYAIESKDEAIAYLQNDILSKRLIAISQLLLDIEQTNTQSIFGVIDSKKLKSCMTLFGYVSEKDSVFHKVLHKFYGGKIDCATIKILQNQ